MQIKNLDQLDLNRIVRKVNLIIPAQSAKMGPPVGPVLGQVKIKVKDFCTLFNDATSKLPVNLPLKVNVFVFKNETFNFIIKTPSVGFLLKNQVKINKANLLSLLDIYKIALIKKMDFQYLSLKTVYRNILYIAKIMNIKINYK